MSAQEYLSFLNSRVDSLIRDGYLTTDTPAVTLQTVEEFADLVEVSSWWADRHAAVTLSAQRLGYLPSALIRAQVRKDYLDYKNTCRTLTIEGYEAENPDWPTLESSASGIESLAQDVVIELTAKSNPLPAEVIPVIQVDDCEPLDADFFYEDEEEHPFGAPAVSVDEESPDQGYAEPDFEDEDDFDDDSETSEDDEDDIVVYHDDGSVTYAKEDESDVAEDEDSEWSSDSDEDGDYDDDDDVISYGSDVDSDAAGVGTSDSNESDDSDDADEEDSWGANSDDSDDEEDDEDEDEDDWGATSDSGAEEPEDDEDEDDWGASADSDDEDEDDWGASADSDDEDEEDDWVGNSEDDEDDSWGSGDDSDDESSEDDEDDEDDWGRSADASDEEDDATAVVRPDVVPNPVAGAETGVVAQPGSRQGYSTGSYGAVPAPERVLDDSDRLMDSLTKLVGGVWNRKK